MCMLLAVILLVWKLVIYIQVVMPGCFYSCMSSGGQDKKEITPNSLTCLLGLQIPHCLPDEASEGLRG